MRTPSEQTPIGQTILAYLTSHSPALVPEIARDVGISRGAIARHLYLLRGTRLVTFAKVECEVNPALRTADGRI